MGGSVAGKLCYCDKNCNEVQCCGPPTYVWDNESRIESPQFNNSYRNLTAIDDPPYTLAHCATADIIRPSIKYYNQRNETVNNQHYNTFCNSYSLQCKRSKQRSNKYQLYNEHMGLKNEPPCMNPPFPTVEKLSVELNNNNTALSKPDDFSFSHQIQKETHARLACPFSALHQSRKLPIDHNEFLTQYPDQGSHPQSFCKSENNRPRMNSNHESYVLSGSSQADVDEWVKAIRRVILSPFGGGIFGQCLEDTLKYDHRMKRCKNQTTKAFFIGVDQDCNVPIIVQNCVEFIRFHLNEEGLFRLPGQANEVKEFRDAYDMGERPVFLRTTDVHTVTSLLKCYLRELPEPVITFERYDALIEAVKLLQTRNEQPKSTYGPDNVKEIEDPRKRIKEQAHLLPKANFDLLQYLCRFLHEVQLHSSSNKMDVFNLALVFGPNMMRSKIEDALLMISDTNHVQQVMRRFIEDHSFIFSDYSEDSNGTKETETGDQLKELAEGAIEACEAGLGTLTTTASLLGTLEPRNSMDDSGTGSLAPTPENTQKRVPLVSNKFHLVQKPVKPAKTNKPMRLKKNSHAIVDDDIVSCGYNRKSYYDNVSTSIEGSSQSSGRNYWRGSKNANHFFCDQSQPSTEEASYYSNRGSQSKTSNSSMQVATSGFARLRSSRTGVVEDTPDSPSSAHPPVFYRQKFMRRARTRVSAEEFHTASVAAEKQASLNASGHRSDFHNNASPRISPGIPRTISCPPTKTQHGESFMDRNRLSNGFGCNVGSSTTSSPVVPSTNHLRMKKEDIDQQDKLTDGNSVAPLGSATSSNITSAGTSVSSRPFTYKEMEQQVFFLKEELNKQRIEHEKRSRMLEEHYVIKLQTSSTGGHEFCSDQYTSSLCNQLAGQEMNDQPVLSAESNAVRGQSETDDSLIENHDVSFSRTVSGLSRAFSVESQAEMRYRDEVKRHAITKIRLRNTERALRQAEERNEQLQREMENFFETFGSVLPKFIQ